MAKATKVVIKKYGFLGSIFRPFALLTAGMIAVYGLGTFGTTYWRSYQRHVAYSQAVHPDKTRVEIAIHSSLPAFTGDAIALTIKNDDGTLRRVVTSRQARNAFVAGTLKMLETERDLVKASARRDLAQLFDLSFADRGEAVDGYADWFFAWKRSYVVLKETVGSAVTRFFKLGEYESLSDAVEHDIKDYFMKHYQARVLKPEARDALITRGLEASVRRAHDSYRRVINNGDMRLQLFLAKHTRHLETVEPGGKMTQLSLDWDSQKWKAPSYLIEDKAFKGIAGLGSAAAGGTLGALMLGPAMNRVMAQSFSGLSRQFVTSMGTRLALAEKGAIAGTAINPAGGQVVGLAIGIGVGFAADYFINKANEKFSRGKFVAANNKALDITIGTWRAKLSTSVDQAIDRWFDDARTGIMLAGRPLEKAATQAPSQTSVKVKTRTSGVGM